jgi:hypothetical protein
VQVVRLDGVKRFEIVNDVIGAAATRLGGSHFAEQTNSISTASVRMCYSVPAHLTVCSFTSPTS